MNDYTSAAKESDRYLRNGGPDYGHRIRMMDDPVYAHRHLEAITSMAEETNRVEGRIMTTKTPAHVNIHD